MNKQLTKDELTKICGGEVMWQREIEGVDFGQPANNSSNDPNQKYRPAFPQPGGNLV